MTWLRSTPTAVVDAMSTMIPRLEADEARHASTVVAVGRSFKPGRWAKQQQAEWDRAARGGRSAAKKAPSAGELSAVGIKLKGAPRG